MVAENTQEIISVPISITHQLTDGGGGGRLSEGRLKEGSVDLIFDPKRGACIRGER